MRRPAGRRQHLRSWLSRLREREFVRFLVIGALNTLFTYLVYVGLVLFLTYSLAYTVTYAFGIAVSYYFNARVVFRQKLRLAAALQYPAVYLIQYLLGLVLLYVLVELAHVSKFIAPIFVVLVSVPITYLSSRYVIAQRGSAGKETTEAPRT